MIDTNAEFLQPAKFNDELIATARLVSHTRATFLIEQNIYREGLDGELLCKGMTKAAYVNADSKKPVRIPEILMKNTA